MCNDTKPETLTERIYTGQNKLNPQETKIYTLMERIDTELRKYIETGGLNDAGFINVAIQVIHSIGMMQKYEIVHGDMHTGNIFLDVIDDEYKWNGQLLSKFDYFEYQCGDFSIFIPYHPVIAKIGDFGLSVKYSKPMIGDKETIKNGYADWLPRFFSKSYDIVYFLNFCRITCDDINLSTPTPVFVDILTSIYGKSFSSQFNNMNNRPIIENLTDDINPKSVLESSFFSDYRKQPPPGSKIITLGSWN